MYRLYNILFADNFNMPAFIFMIIAVVLFCFFLKIYGNKKIKWFILAVSFVFSLVVLIRTTSFNKEDYSRFIRHHSTGCLYETYDERDVSVTDEMTNRILLIHYFDNGKKRLVFHENFEAKEDFVEWIGELCPVIELEDTYVSKLNFTEEQFENVKDNINRVKYKEKRFYLDSSWEKSDTIVAFSMDDNECFVSKELFDNLNKGSYENNYLPKEYVECSGYECLSKLRGEKDIYQIILLVMMFIIGYLCCQSIFGKNQEFLSAFLAIPLFSTIYCTITILGIVIGISINKLYISLCMGLILCASVWKIIKQENELDKRRAITCLIGAIIVIVYFVYSKLWILETDGYAKTIYGVMLSEYNLSKQEILSFMPFGMFDPIINNLAWNFHTDFLYAIYPIWTICIIGTVAYLYFRSVERTKYNVILFCVSIFFFVTNSDRMFNTFFIMSNGMVGCMTTLLILSVIFKIKFGYNTDIIVYAMTLVIITTRVEGTCYICLLFALLCGQKTYREKCKKMNFIVAIEIIFWQVALMLFSAENSIFWDRNKGIMLMIAAGALMGFPYVLSALVNKMGFIEKYYYRISMVVLLVISLALIYFGPEMAYPTAQIFAKHFTTSYLTNSGAFWAFAIFSIIYIQNRDTKFGWLFLAIVVDYLLLTYMIFCFREGVLIHTCENDSCRRVIQQIMPMTLIAILYISSDKEAVRNDVG